MPDKKSKRRVKGAGAGATGSHWGSESADHDFSAAVDYLSLSAAPAAATVLAGRLRRAPLVTRRANDLLRASGLPLLGPDDVKVAKDLARLKAGEKMAPVLLIRGDLHTGRPLVVADGYHRICASYHVSEESDIPCRIADPTAGPATRTSPRRRSAGPAGAPAPADAAAVAD